MKHLKKIGIGMVFVAGSVVVLAVQSIIPDRKESLESTLEYINSNIQARTQHIASEEELLKKDRAFYQEKQCELANLKLADDEDIQPETYSLCFADVEQAKTNR